MSLALVTGASGGIGLELARIHADKGGDVVLTSRSEDKLEALSSDLTQEFGIKVFIIKADLSMEEGVDHLIEKVSELDRPVEFLLNNAGFGDYGPFADSAWEKQSEMIRLNVTALSKLTHHFLPSMIKEGRGRILNVASTAAFQPGPFMSVYYATKHYVLSFSEAIASELKGTGVTVTALCPGPTHTGFGDVANMNDAGVFGTKALKVASAREVAEYGYRSMMQGRTVAIHGMRNKIMASSVRFMPRKAVTSIVKKIQKK